jgi:putative endonuclease
MPYAVYILRSDLHDRYYIGQTENLHDRFKRHNAGTEKATAPFMPWILLWQTEKSTRAEAVSLERKLKNLSRQRLIAFIEKYSTN